MAHLKFGSRRAPQHNNWPPNPSNKLVVTVVCGAGCGWAEHTHAQVKQDISKPRHIGDCRKALDETSKTITYN